jgi:hypothetical protein
MFTLAASTAPGYQGDSLHTHAFFISAVHNPINNKNHKGHKEHKGWFT